MRVLRKIKIKNRLIIIFLLVSIVPIIIIGALAIQVYSHSITQKLNTVTEQTVSMIRKNTIIGLEKYLYMAGSISINEKIQDGLELKKDIDYATSSDVKTIMKTFTYPPYVKNILIATAEGDVLYDYGYSGISDKQVGDLLLKITKLSSSDNWSYIKTLKNYDILVLSRRMSNIEVQGKNLGYVLLFIDEALFSQDILADVSLGAGSSIILVNANGVVLSSNTGGFPLGQPYEDTGLLTLLSKKYANESHTLERIFKDEKESVSYTYIKTMDCFLISKVPFSYIYSEVKVIQNTIYVAILIVCIACIVMIFLLHRSIVKPINKIVDNCNITSSGDLSARINDSYSDEIGFLGKSINSMLDKIELLMANQKLEQRRKRKLELQMLQYQINPHFLFNTLNTLKWIAVINKTPIVSNGIGALSDLLQSTIVNKNEFIPLQEELDNLNNYFEIQKIRYADMFDVKYEVDATLLNNMIPKFILQPIAENSILHGIDEKNVTITIKCITEDNNLIITVEDDGVGFNMEDADLSSNKQMTGIGLPNVDERLKLSFGEEYGLTLTSEIGIGTVCRIKIPSNFTVIEEEDDDKHTIS